MDIKEEDEKENDDITREDNYADPVANFLIVLKASETNRQYPKRLDVFHDFLGLEVPLKTMCWLYKFKM